MDRPEDIVRDPAVHAVTYRFDDRPWGLGWRPECSCGWRGSWCDYRTDAEQSGAAHVNGGEQLALFGGGAP